MWSHSCADGGGGARPLPAPAGVPRVHPIPQGGRGKEGGGKGRGRNSGDLPKSVKQTEEAEAKNGKIKETGGMQINK